MKPIKNIFFLLFLGQFLLQGCYPGGAETTDDFTIVKTQYNTAYDFSDKKTYYLPDSMLFQTNIDDEDIDEEELSNYEETLLAAIKENMDLRGYTLEKSDTTNIDLVVLPSAMLTNSSGAAWIPGGGWWGGYYPPGWGWGGGWYYPPGYGGYWSAYSYTTGTVFIVIADYDSYEISNRESIEIEWDAAIDGLFQGVNANKIDKLVKQAFEQSPYLTSNLP